MVNILKHIILSLSPCAQESTLSNVTPEHKDFVIYIL